jgi:hypothetical protein
LKIDFESRRQSGSSFALMLLPRPLLVEGILSGGKMESLCADLRFPWLCDFVFAGLKVAAGLVFIVFVILLAIILIREVWPKRDRGY